MKISFWAIGKPHDITLKKAIDEFSARIPHYFPLEWKIFPAPKISNRADLMKAESAMLKSAIRPGDYLIMLDENGKQLDSPQLATLIEKQSFQSTKQLVFIIGGAYGFAEDFLKQSQFVWSLSRLTFPHQLVRLILSEQVYRACTIIRNEKYHHS